MGNIKKMVGRSKKLAFYGIPGDTEQITYKRMTGFTSLSQSKNPKEYSRQYVDEDVEQTDIVGYSPSISYAFDQYKDNAVHEDIIKITDEELTTEDAVREIIIVDMTSETKAAKKRSYSVIPDAEGDTTDAYTYTGNFKAKSKIVLGVATSEDNWETITFTENEK